jgi:WD40 repeat protein
MSGEGSLWAGTLKVWRVADGKVLATTECGSTLPGTKVSFSRDGSRLLAGGPAVQNSPIGTGTRVTILRVSDWAVLRRLVFQTSSNYSGALAISADGQRVAVGKRYPENGIDVRRVDDGAPVFQLDGHAKPVDTVLASDDKSLVFSADPSEARLWRMADGALLDIVPGGVKVSTDGTISYVAVAKNSSAYLSCKP